MERLDKFLADHADFSRADAQKRIRWGRVTVDGAVVRDPSLRIDPAVQAVVYDGRPLGDGTSAYYMLNKPAGILCVSRDPKAPTVVDLVPRELRRRGLFPAGRLDKDTVGLVILTDDGDFAHRMLSPRKQVWKHYIAQLDHPLGENYRAALETGITLSDGTVCRPARLDPPNPDAPCTVGIHITEGKFHQVKRMFEAADNRVVALKRVAIGGLQLDPTLSEGEMRELTKGELDAIFG